MQKYSQEEMDNDMMAMFITGFVTAMAYAMGLGSILLLSGVFFVYFVIKYNIKRSNDDRFNNR